MIETLIAGRWKSELESLNQIAPNLCNSNFAGLEAGEWFDVSCDPLFDPMMLLGD